MFEIRIGSGMGRLAAERDYVAQFQRMIGVFDDGMFGPVTEAAARESLALYGIPYSGVVKSQVWADLWSTIGSAPLPWGQRVSADFKAEVRALCLGLGLNPAHLMNCIAFETGETFSPSVRNAAGSGATGLIQFMPATARALGTTVEALAGMSAVAQLSYVYRYFLPFKGRLTGLDDVYMAILYPAAVGRDRNFVLFRGGTIAFRQNSGLDANRDLSIQKWEAARAVFSKVRKGNALLA